MTMRTVGVEEELLLVEPGTGQPLAVAETALGAGQQEETELAFELQRQQLETNTTVCHDLGELAREVRRCRSLAAEAAAEAGARVAALGTSPAPVLPQLVREGRYLRMARVFGITAEEQLTRGCHVHVGISSADEAVAVLDRIGPWLAVLLALSANSPFWQGRDTSYASFRYQAWGAGRPRDRRSRSALSRPTSRRCGG
jgi:glutamate---cysteine ligase / carboxylate-amine ligase